MTIEDDKKVAEAKAKADAEAKAKAEEEAAKANKGDNDGDEDENGDDDGDDDGSSSQQIDYKAELEKERKAREAAEKLIAESKFKSKHKKDEEEDDDDQDDDEDKPLTRRELESLLEKNRLKTIKETNSERVMEIAGEIADSQEEAELIAEIYKNRQFPAHLSVREQVEEAQAIANRKKIVSQKSELARALKNKANVSKDGADTHRDGQQGTKPKMSSQDESAYKRAGFEFDNKGKVWKKKLPNGKFLIKDPKTKANYLK